MKYAVPILLICCIGISCKREPFWKKDKDPCALDFSMGDCGTAEWIQQGAHYERPCFNPNNGDELVFLESDSPDAGIVKYNIRTGEKTTILSGVPIAYTPEWGQEGWIVFSSSGSVMKVREDGSEMTSLTDWGRAQYPVFNPEGSLILYARWFEYTNFELQQNPSLKENFKMMTVDLEGNPVDSFCREMFDQVCSPWQECSWSSDGTMIVAEYGPNSSGKDYGLAIYGPDGSVNKVLFTKEETAGSSEIVDIDWHPNGQDIYFVDSEGIKRVNAETGAVDLIRLTCGNERYGPLAISPNGKFIVAEYYIAITQECANTFKYGLSLMTVDGLNEETLPLP